MSACKSFSKPFNRSFYFSSKNKLGYTEIESITDNQGPLAWTRLKDQLDIIEFIPEPLNPGEIIFFILIIKLNYQR